MSRRRLVVLLAVLVLVTGLVVVVVARGQDTDEAVSDGRARFQVLSPTLIRVEYAEDGVFEDRPTFNAIERDLPDTSFSTAVEEGGVRVVRTDRLTLRYRQGSGPFTSENLSVELKTGPRRVTARPVWHLAGSCYRSTACQLETARLGDGAVGLADEPNHTGRGFAGLFARGSRVDWTQRDVPAAGEYRVHLRYSSRGEQTLVVSGGGADQRITLPSTGESGSWSTASTTLRLPAGDTPMSLRCETEVGCDVEADAVAVTPPRDPYPESARADAEHAAANLGAWRRSLDEVGDHDPARTMTYEGLLSRDGWYLLNDTETAVAGDDGSTTPRPARDKPYQDGYFFGYGHDLRQGLADLKALTGPPVMLPQWAFGTWYSRYGVMTDAQYRGELLPRFRAEQVPLDVLVVDTDFKAGNDWNGWDWDAQLFPDPRGFLDWADQQGLRVSLNVHPSIDAGDPRYPEVVRRVGRELEPGVCGLGEGFDCRVFDMSEPAQRDAYFALHDQFEQLGHPVLWWLDSCCDGTRYRPEGVSPDSLFNAAYARRADERGQRGFSWNRSGSGFTGYGDNRLYPAGPWAEHRYTVDTSMDTRSSWEMLGYASYYTIRRGNVGMAYESHDIGAHNFSGSPENVLPPDLYARWVQLGTFQPIMRLHSNHGARLPWEYPEPARSSAASFLRLREALLPHTYTLGREAHDTGLPMNRGLYLNYPEHPEAHEFDQQYLYGDDVLVAPVTTPGTENVPTRTWIPPGEWTNWFTGETLTGPAVTTVTTDLSTMPVFLRAGGILPTRTDRVEHATQRPLDRITLDVATGAPGSYDLYEDEGDGHGYRDDAFARTPISYDDGEHALTVDARAGTFPGAVDGRTWTVRFRDVDEPSAVTVDGREVSEWSYDAGTRTLTATASARADQRVVVGFRP
ncbi:TIM-barrel domain-containing protein [Umezawaea beigongshangensis]|uniref:TIM-barrel domain-containing protein n=1 Tax=Umezawaea beigongshangensis TaxID=2780383 RepID=UPI0018F1A0ED|nr:TIM-barrel domain-containing protein [Umezawaea beigongshangensis]